MDRREACAKSVGLGPSITAHLRGVHLAQVATLAERSPSATSLESAEAALSALVATDGVRGLAPRSDADGDIAFVQCPECSLLIFKPGLRSHLKRVHERQRHGGFTAEELRLIRKELGEPEPDRHRQRDSSPPGIPAAPADTGTIEIGAEERRLDASRDYWPNREHGKFGSHSVHDDHGDDGEP